MLGLLLKAGAKAATNKGVQGQIGRTVANSKVNPGVTELNRTIRQLNQKRDSLVASGLSEKSSAVRANAKAVQKALQERSRLAK